MTPFLAEMTYEPNEVVLVIGTVWSGARVFLVFVRADRSFGYMPTETMRLHQMTADMPDIFEWPTEAFVPA